MVTISGLRGAAKQIWEAALAAADPELSLKEAVRLTETGFAVGDTEALLTVRAEVDVPSAEDTPQLLEEDILDGCITVRAKGVKVVLLL